MFYQYNVHEPSMPAPVYYNLHPRQSAHPSSGIFYAIPQARGRRSPPVYRPQWQTSVPCVYYPAEDSESSDEDFELSPSFLHPPVVAQPKASLRKHLPRSARYSDEWVSESPVHSYAAAHTEPYREYDSYLKRRNVDLLAAEVENYHRFLRAKAEQEERELAAQRLEARRRAEEKAAAARRAKQLREAHALQMALERIALEEESEEEPQCHSLFPAANEVHRSTRRSRHHRSSKKHQKSLERRQKAEIAQNEPAEHPKQFDPAYFLFDLSHHRQLVKEQEQRERAEAEAQRANELRKQREQQKREKQEREQQEREQQRAAQEYQNMLRAQQIEIVRESAKRAARIHFEEMQKLAKQQQQHKDQGEELTRRSAIEFSNNLSQKELEKLQAKREHEARQRVMSNLRRPVEEETAVKEDPKPQLGDNAVEVTSPESVPPQFWEEFSGQLSELVADNDPTISENDIITITITDRGKVFKFYVPASRIASLKAARNSNKKNASSNFSETKPKAKSMKSKKIKPQTNSTQTESAKMEFVKPKTSVSGVAEPQVEELKKPKVKEPKVEEPKVEEPKTQDIKAEKSKVEEPKVEEPSDCESGAEDFTVVKKESPTSISRASSPSSSIRHVTIEDIEDSDASSDFN